MTFVYILISILLFGLLILVHEFGHFITAKLSGVRVNEFSMFMGPAIFQRTKGETTYSIRCLPIGGYCAMEGEDGDSEDPRAFGRAKLWKRLVILAAGSLMNFLVGFLIIVLYVSLTSNATTPIPTVEISGFAEGCPLYSETGLQPGDRFYSIDGERVYINGDILMLLERGEDTYYDVVVLRDGVKVTLKQLEMVKQDYDGQVRYGFSCNVTEKSFGSVLGYSWNYCRDFVRLVRMGLGDLFTGRTSVKEMSGPVGIVEVVTQSATRAETTGRGFLNVLYFFGFIAINLAVMNLLPIPALDGGRIVCLLLTAVVEKITRRKLNPKYEAYLHGAGMVLLLALMALITFKDIFHLFGG